MTDVRVEQIAAEVVRAGGVTVRVAQIGAEVIHSGGVTVRVAQIGLEVVRSVASVASGNLPRRFFVAS